MLKLYGRATSGNVQKVIFLLEELGQPYERLDYGRQFGNTGTPEYLAMNPTNKVPTLADGDLIVWESNTILRYLGSRYGASLYPADPAQRTFVERWMDWTLASLNPVYLAGFKDAKKPKDEQAADTGPNLAAELKILDTHLREVPWCAGQSFSLADIALAPLVRRCVSFPFALPEMPGIAAWLARIGERPAFAKATSAG
ncbi:glutathione S-transferase family protein [Pandoraea pulmonicola]|uniref:Glutathione S-transferase n=1 Tax=Pandoraea pulmonicola TaxID=93221 RepID=A0AAJ4ZA98_PANPU|nr:glutathione S-transferase family protein [Pandoraea pulmonicola]AJC21568.1 glutathione S-transferase [Pandoraea pulmonicola]SUA89624.1 Glutathione S-transferase GstB [Pandoraea pulmonicola]